MRLLTRARPPKLGRTTHALPAGDAVLALHLCTDAVLVLGLDGRIAWANHRSELLFGMTEDLLVGQPVHDLLPEEAADMLAWAICLGGPPDDPITLSAPIGHVGRWYQVRAFPGQRAMAVFFAELGSNPARSGDGGPSCATHEAFDALPQPTAVVDHQGWIIRTNRRWDESPACFGNDASSANGASNLFDRCRQAADDGRTIGRLLLDGMQSVLSGAADDFSHDYASMVDGAEQHFCVQVVPAQDHGLVITHIDITDRIRSEAEARHQAEHDELTGLPNRSVALDLLRSRMASRAERATTLLYIDLDGFKAVNDELGHAVGDRLLQAVASRLRTTARSDDLLARLGGDEFVLVTTATLSTAHAIGERIREVVSNPFSIDGDELTLSASIGVAMLTDDHTMAEEVLQDADDAMYAAKRAGKDRLAVYRSDTPAGHSISEQARHAPGAPPD